MGGFFGAASNDDCVQDLFYGTDYHSHLGTKRGGLAVANGGGILRYIHNIENAQFRSKFEDDLAARKAIRELEGPEPGDVTEYTRAGSAKYQAMVKSIAKRLNLTSLKYQKLEDLVAAIGLPKEKVCTFCWDGANPS